MLDPRMNLALLVLLATGVISKLDFNPQADEPIMMQPKGKIVEDLNNLDLSKLPIHSREIKTDENCEDLKTETINYRYDTKTNLDEDVSVLISSSSVLDDSVHRFLIMQDSPWINGSLTIKPHLNCYDHDEPKLIEEIKNRLVEPNNKEYNFSAPIEENINGEVGQPRDVDRVVFGGELKNGFFLEAGSFNAEFNSDSLYFEINHGWTGLLVEPYPLAYGEGLLKNRKATHLQTCLSTHTKTQTVLFDTVGSIRNETHRESMAGITNVKRDSEDQFMMQCFPLYSVLLSLGNPTVNYFSLDVEGAEFAILRTVPWDKVDIQVLSVETHLLDRLFPGDRTELIEFMDSVGYVHVPWGHTVQTYSRNVMGTTDDMFVKKGIQLKMTREEKEKMDRKDQEDLDKKEEKDRKKMKMNNEMKEELDKDLNESKVVNSRNADEL
ncbi:uncharacterized protein LOC111696953 [Eurytemora carolleeae]|uniref:uncharacterized protein LOC111696953 n=1 Tax=Eurytemora carolleeae TaxID=1294199 RepID=UPI000C77D9E6|nr:uncharacterized protein LOC111696953 [Eurytemora carolleeae]|eukprot:XP_023322539.1 uncharacterized protein LOC111696953 [Eurytemora affinis]